MTILQEIHHVFAENAEVISIVGFLAGALVGNRIAIGRDKRNEFNTIVGPIRIRLVEALDSPNSASGCPTSVEVDRLDFYLGCFARRRFSAAIENYQKCCEEQRRQDSFGQLHYEDFEAIRASINVILSAIKLR